MWLHFEVEDEEEYVELMRRIGRVMCPTHSRHKANQCPREWSTMGGIVERVK